MRRRRGLGAAAALCLSLTGFGLLPAIPASAADLTVRGVSAWDDSFSGIVHVVGEVLNSGAVNYQTVRVSCTLVDAGGATLTEPTSIEANILMPGEKAPFDTLFFTGAGSHSPNCSVTGAQTSFQPDHNFTAVITAVQFPGDGSQHVVGTLTNNNTVVESNIRVILTSYDPISPGTVIDEGVAWVDGPVSANGGTTTFDLNANTTRHWDTTPADSAALSEAPSPAVVLSTDTLSFPDQVQGTVSAKTGPDLHQHPDLWGEFSGGLRTGCGRPVLRHDGEAWSRLQHGHHVHAGRGGQPERDHADQQQRERLTKLGHHDRERPGSPQHCRQRDQRRVRVADGGHNRAHGHTADEQWARPGIDQQHPGRRHHRFRRRRVRLPAQ